MNCKHCNSTNYYAKPSGRKIGLYCANCNTWISWITYSDICKLYENKDNKPIDDNAAFKRISKSKFLKISIFLTILSTVTKKKRRTSAPWSGAMILAKSAFLHLPTLPRNHEERQITLSRKESKKETRSCSFCAADMNSGSLSRLCTESEPLPFLPQTSFCRKIWNTAQTRPKSK